MRNILVIPDGMADFPSPLLSGLTPFEAAYTPAMEAICRKGEIFYCRLIEEGSEVSTYNAVMSLLGYGDYIGKCSRAYLEAMGAGVAVSPDDILFRCSFISIVDGEVADIAPQNIDRGYIGRLLHMVNEMGRRYGIEIIEGRDYRHLAISRNKRLQSRGMVAVPELSGEYFLESVEGVADSAVRKFLRECNDILSSSKENLQRMAAGLAPVNGVWLWGGGKGGSLPSFWEMHGIERGCVVCATQMMRGLGIALGLDVATPAGATGDVSTDISAKTEATFEALENHEFVMIHIEAPDEASHRKDPVLKKDVIERIDSELIAPLLKYVSEREDVTLTIVPDHYTDSSTGRHDGRPVPVACFPGKERRRGLLGKIFREIQADYLTKSREIGKN